MNIYTKVIFIIYFSNTYFKSFIIIFTAFVIAHFEKVVIMSFFAEK